MYGHEINSDVSDQHSGTFICSNAISLGYVHKNKPPLIMADELLFCVRVCIVFKALSNDIFFCGRHNTDTIQTTKDTASPIHINLSSKVIRSFCAPIHIVNRPNNIFAVHLCEH